MTRRPALVRALVGTALASLLVSGCQAAGDAALPESGTSAAPAGAPGTAPATRPAPARAPGATRTPATSTPRPPKPGPVLLLPHSGGDGDSWKDRAGVEYRLGLVNAPELNECFGSTASARRKALTRAGFTAAAYTTDDYGRRVSVITLADGRNLNVLLAREGYVNDRYLAQFRSENRALAAQLDTAFAAARRERAGLWGACSSGSAVPQGVVAPVAPAAPTTAPTRSAGCDAAYPGVCIPSPEPDLDCGDIAERRFRVLAPDPHRFDADGNGLGCESG